ncbi:MAG: GGDEF domain-containing protein [Nitrosospira sp.]
MRPPLMEDALEKNHSVREKMESCITGLSSVNESMREGIKTGYTFQEMEKALAQNESVEDRIQECMGDLCAVNTALAQEISDHNQLNRELVNTLQKLSGKKASLPFLQNIWEIVHEVVKETQKRTLTDFVTGIPNRELFHDRLEQALALAKRHDWDLAVMFIDLDRFKPINDTYGHAVGDGVLKMVAQRLDMEARSEDTICRYGGDEFLYLLVNPQGTENIQRIAHKVSSLISSAVVINDRRLTVDSSIGITVYPENGTSGAELIANADTAMYRAKEAGAGPVFFDETIRKKFKPGLDVT